MTFTALNCPQCSAPLPRVALWRSVNCSSCGALITRSGSLVQRDLFRQALLRARQADATGASLNCGGSSYRILQDLGSGEHSTVHLARRMGPLPMLVTLKLASSDSGAERHTREAAIVRELQATDPGGAGAFFSRLLPEVVGIGMVDGNHRHALILRNPTGYWGSLGALADQLAGGLDPRHTVWIWRRILAVLGFVHGHGWSHGDVRPEHALVHAPTHGVRLIGWGSARRGSGPDEQAEDLQHSARIIRVLLSTSGGGLSSKAPEGLVQFVDRASNEPDFCRAHGAPGLDEQLRTEARKVFGPPTFVPLTI
jgi:serine/threonine protein kinase